MARAMRAVPAPNWSNSNTPTGPFQMMVPALATICARCSAVFGPMSRIISSAPTASAATRLARARADSSGATTTSTGSGTCAPRFFIISMIACASPIRLGSASDLPMRKPVASKKVLAMPPPTISWSTFSANDFRMVSLVETLEPATIAISGRAGFCSALPSASSSAAISGPAQALRAYLAMPCVVASARCAVPNASLT